MSAWVDLHTQTLTHTHTHTHTHTLTLTLKIALKALLLRRINLCKATNGDHHSHKHASQSMLVYKLVNMCEHNFEHTPSNMQVGEHV